MSTDPTAAFRNWGILVVRQGVMLLLTLGGVYGLSQLLSPEQFATYGYTSVAMLAAAAAGDLGLGAGIIRTGGRADRLGPSLGLQLAVLLPVSLVLLAGLAAFTGSTLPVAGVVATLVLFSIATLPTSLLEQRTEFTRIGAVEVGQRAVFVLVALALAVISPSDWAVPAAGAAAGAFACAAALRMARWRHRPTSWRGRRLFGGFASHWWQARIANHVNYAAFPLLTGLILTQRDAGLVVWALAITAVPTQLAPLAARAVFPSLTDATPAQVVETYRSVMKGLLLVAIPLIAALFVCAEPLTRYFFGEEWLGAVGLLRLGCVTAVMACVLSPLHPLLFTILPSAWVRTAMLTWTAATWTLTPGAVAVWGAAAAFHVQIVGGLVLLAVVARRLYGKLHFNITADLVPALVSMMGVIPLGLLLADHVHGAAATIATGLTVAALQGILMWVGGTRVSVRDLLPSLRAQSVR